MRDETGMTGYVTDLEVLNKDLFSWICPGKTEFYRGMTNGKRGCMMLWMCSEEDR